MSDLVAEIAEATKAAMKARDKARVAALRLVNAEIKRVEVDERKTLLDDDVVTILNRMVKQRNDSLTQFDAAGRDDLADKERFEIAVIREFLPAQLDEDAVRAIVAETIEQMGATSMRDMGQVMGALKGKLAGRADMAAVSESVKGALSG